MTTPVQASAPSAASAHHRLEAAEVARQLDVDPRRGLTPEEVVETSATGTAATSSPARPAARRGCGSPTSSAACSSSS